MLTHTITNHSFFRYACVGVINTLICVSVMYLVSLVYSHYMIYTAAGYIVAIIASFIMNYYFTFSVRGQVQQRMIKFMIIALLNLGFVEFMQWCFIEGIGWPILPSIIFCAILYTVLGYILNRRYVFN